MNSVGFLIKNKREKLGITQKGFATSLGFTAQFLGRIETGAVGLPQKYWFKTMRLLRIKKAQLFECMMHDYEKQLKESFK